MHYTELDNTYLLDAVERIADALRTATGLDAVVTLQGQELPASGWIVVVTGMTEEEHNSDMHVQTWEVQSWYVFDPKTPGADRMLYRAMYTAIPTAYNYLKAHKRLIFVAGQEPITYLRREGVSVRLSYIDNESRATIVHRLPFLIPLQQED